MTQRLPVGRYPYDVAAGPDGTVYASAWGDRHVAVFRPDAGGRLVPAPPLVVGRHPSALLLSRDGSRLFVVSSTTDRVAVVDTRARTVVAELWDPPPAGPDEGTTPNALALSEDGTRLFVAEADANAIAVFDLSAASSGVPSASGNDRLAGRIPVDWYPSEVLVRGDTVLAVSAKGHGTAPNPRLPHPGEGTQRQDVPDQYTLGQLQGVVRTVPGAVSAAGDRLAAWSARVAAANRWDRPRAVEASYPPFEHVIYVIKENRTYDQVLGDLPQADGDTSLVFFGRDVAPNHHALAERFGIFDRFFVNAEVSADGHNWSTAAYAADYVEKTVASQYSGRRPYYDYEGTNRGMPVSGDDDVNEPANGYLWNLAERAGVTFRDYGEFVYREDEEGNPKDFNAPLDEDDVYQGDKAFLHGRTSPDYPGFNLDIPDQRRADVWIDELKEFSRTGRMPQLEVIRLPNDHTAGARAGAPTPRAFMADNDLALGRMVEALSKSPFWKNTVMFVLEDDAQNGPDHVDSHRSPLIVVSAYNRGGVIHRFANTTDVIATISEILRMGSLSQFDHYGRPLRDVFGTEPDLRPYTALRPKVSLDERNPKNGAGAAESARIDLSAEDRVDDMLFNRILWKAIKGDVPYPGARRSSSLEMRRAH